MSVYTVHKPRRDERARTVLNDQLAFVPDGVVWLALFLPLPWLLLHRLWLAALAYVVAMALLIGFLPDILAGFAAALLHVMIALEGDALRRWSLAQRGYELVDVVMGASRQACEQRFFERWVRRRGPDPIGPHPIGPDPTSLNPTGPDRSGASLARTGDTRASAAPRVGRDGRKSSHSRSQSPALDEDVIGLFPQND